jgi:hypothetical protein
MPKLLPPSDFRARRTVLTRNDFAYAPKPLQTPTDVIAKPTWDGIVVLPDDVAVRTSNYHGTALAQLHDLWGVWVECFGNVQDFMLPVMLDAGDDFQAATYSALTGFYRLSVAALRSALELVTIGAWAQVSEKASEFRMWRAGEMAILFGQACDGLIGSALALDAHVRTATNDTLFEQKTSSSEGGFARRIFSGLSEFSHSRPGYADADMRRSNGPIYVGSAFNHVAWLQFETLGLCFTLVLLARPKQLLPNPAVELFRDVKRVKSRATRAAFDFLYAGRG